MKLTKAEKKWLDDFQKLMHECPSNRFGSYTIGDNNIVIFDGSKEDEINDMLDSREALDFYSAVNKLDAEVDRIFFPFFINSTQG